MFRKLMVAVVSLLVVVALPQTASAAPGRRSAAAPVVKPYIVVLKSSADVDDVAGEHARRHGAEVHKVYGAAIKGYAARVPEDRVDELRSDPRVAYVEVDGPVSVAAQTLPWGVNKIDADLSSTRAGNGSGSVTNVNAYVIDTGIKSHADLYLGAHQNFTGDGKNYDCNGHGTHVAGTTAARDNSSYLVGVAPGVRLTGLKALDCTGNGSMSNVIAAVNWVTTNAKKPAVANLSLNGGISQALDDAVRTSAASGVLYTVAAGNSGLDACNSSPARAGAGTNNGIVTVAASDSGGREPSWSNYGSCVDIWAPGMSIVSTSSNGGTATMSGTSMAAPHVAGAGALFLSKNTTTSPANAEAKLKANVLSSSGTSKDGRAIKVVYAGRY